MKLLMTTTLLGAAITAFSGLAIADEAMDIGKQEFMSKCAVCHGVDGRGDGPYAQLLTRPPTDLTTLTQRNDGKFPVEWIAQVIDGRVLYPVHGTHEMPVWGRQFVMEAAFDDLDEGRFNDETYARMRVMALVDQLYRMQR